MSDIPNDAAVSRAVAAARGVLSAEDAAKIERLAGDPKSLKELTSKLSQRDWANVMRIVNDPELLKRVLSSTQGKNMLHDFLNKIN